MASAKKKQDEKNLKILRDLISLSGNKECFDCQQRGPTYANMTIGSFVCTTCSGMLRGLTPPHRVKSISIATFTQEEIDFLKDRGNEFCKAIWLGLMSQKKMWNNKDDQIMKDFMSAKYELKRYYLDPVIANQLLYQKSQNCPKVQFDTKNIKVFSVNSISPAPNSIKKDKENKTMNAINFIADFSKVPDPLPLTIPSKFPKPIIPQPSFAKFDDNPAFIFTKVNTISSLNGISNTNRTIDTSPSEDRYAALKDLDSLMKQTNLKDNQTFIKTPWNLKETNNITVKNSSSSVLKNNFFLSNPFVDDTWQPSMNINNNNNHNIINNNNNNIHLIRPNVFNTANPFTSTQVSVYNNDLYSFKQDSKNIENARNALLSQTNKSWEQTVTGFKINSFTVSSNNIDVTPNLNNPFL